MHEIFYFPTFWLLFGLSFGLSIATKQGAIVEFQTPIEDKI